jgi:hypothetical protein
MQIGNLPGYYTAQNYAWDHATAAAQEPSKQQPAPGIIVEISPEAKDAYKKSLDGVPKSKDAVEILEYEGCQTCKNRKYKDQSNDPSVSFQAPTHIDPSAAAAAVSSHEREHVSHEKARAEREGREIVNQTVTLKTGICPECHRMYVSGGVTRTTSVEKSEPPTPEQAIDLEA